MGLQRLLASVISGLLICECFAGLGIFFLQGFHFAGFNLPDRLMHWIGAVTIGTTGTLAAIVYRAVFSSMNVGDLRKQNSQQKANHRQHSGHIKSQGPIDAEAISQLGKEILFTPDLKDQIAYEREPIDHCESINEDQRVFTCFL